MNDDYLWDRSGEPDPEIVHLESLLGRFAAHPRNLALPRRFGALKIAAVAAMLVVALGVALFALRFWWRPGEAWPVVNVSGAPTINGSVISSNARLGVDDVLRTDEHSRATVEIARVGELSIEPNSTVSLMQTRGGRHRIRLDRGKVSARVWAPPFTFSVRTPAGLATDIGCAFDLQYDGTAGEVRVTSGWVDFDGENRSSLIPAGAVAELEGDNPGTPYYLDATPAFREALRAYDHGDRIALARVIAEARARDAMTLLHLLERASYSERPALFDGLARLAPPPARVTRDGVLDGDKEMLGQWRKSLGLGGVKRWWLYWRDAL